MPVDDFIVLKDLLVLRDLLAIPQERTPLHNVGNFILKMSMFVDPYVITSTRDIPGSLSTAFDKNASEFHILVQKNLVIGKIGFPYASDWFLARLVI